MNLQPSYEELKGRLERLWRPLGMRGSEEFFTIYLDLSVEVELGCRKEGDGLFIRIAGDLAYLACHPNGEIELGCSFLFAPHPLEEQLRAKSQLAHEWFEAFRRNCWLVGCPIEVTAHEKAEWMREFTKKELDAWDLKM